jgi:hypothetical protein
LQWRNEQWVPMQPADWPIPFDQQSSVSCFRLGLAKTVELISVISIFLERLELKLFDCLCGDIIVDVVQNKIKEHIENVSLDNFSESFINSFEEVNGLNRFDSWPFDQHLSFIWTVARPRHHRLDTFDILDIEFWLGRQHLRPISVELQEAIGPFHVHLLCKVAHQSSLRHRHRLPRLEKCDWGLENMPAKDQSTRKCH